MRNGPGLFAYHTGEKAVNAGHAKDGKNAEPMTPPMMAMDKGMRTSAPGPIAMAGGRAAAMAALEVMRMGVGQPDNEQINRK